MRPLILLFLSATLLTLQGCATLQQPTPSNHPQNATLPHAEPRPESAASAADNTDLFTYRAIIREVYDGDTVTADIDLGFHVWLHGEKLRLYGIDAPEMRGKDRPRGIVSRDWLRQRILGREVLIHTIRDKRGKYGRYLVRIYLDGKDINEELVANGLAIHRQY